MQWVAHARILTPGDCAYIRTAAASRPKLARAFFERLIEIRELIWMIATSLAEQRPVAEKLRASLTAAHAESLRHAEIKMREGVFIWVWDPRRDIQAAILGPITLSAMTLLMETDLLRTKCCAGLECGWLFFDTTKNKRRRWCEMRVCGNRAKVRAARARKTFGFCWKPAVTLAGLRTLIRPEQPSSSTNSSRSISSERFQRTIRWQFSVREAEIINVTPESERTKCARSDRASFRCLVDTKSLPGSQKIPCSGSGNMPPSQ